MAPEGLSIIAGNKRPPEFDKLFSLPVPSKKFKKKKKKSNNIRVNDQSFDCKQEVVSVDSDDDVIVLDNENSDDDVIILNTPPAEIILSGSEEELPASDNFNNDDIILENNNDQSKRKDNIVINIGQTFDIDKIIREKHSNINNTSNSVVNGTRIETKNLSEQLNHVQTEEIQYPKSWTKQMIKYYTEPCERTKNFDYKAILKNMKTQPSDWWINKADRIGPSRNRRSFVQCRKCHRTGHIERECTRKNVCYICGGYNHVFDDCPNALCLTCGTPTRKYLQKCDNCRKYLTQEKSCDLCGQTFHGESLCPSKWRKHLILDNSNQPAKLNPRKFCYNCAGVGHFGFECPLTADSDYPPENPFRTTFFDEGLQHVNDSNNNVIFVSKKTADLLSTENGNQFLKILSHTMNTRIEFFRGFQDYIRFIGKEIEINLFKIEFRKWKSQIGTSI